MDDESLSTTSLLSFALHGEHVKLAALRLSVNICGTEMPEGDDLYMYSVELQVLQSEF